MANIFISHRSADIAAAEKLAEELRNAGQTVWLDKWEISLGDSIVQRMQDGLAKADYVVLCYSSHGVSAPWMSREWMATLARQLNGHNVRLIPCRLTGGDPPAIIADIKYADLVIDWSGGVQEILQAVA